VAVSQTLTVMLETSVALTPIPVRRSRMNARPMLTAMRDSLESVPLMRQEKQLTVNIVSPMVSTMSVNQAACMTLDPLIFPDVRMVLIFAMLTLITVKQVQDPNC